MKWGVAGAEEAQWLLSVEENWGAEEVVVDQGGAGIVGGSRQLPSMVNQKDALQEISSTEMQQRENNKRRKMERNI